MLKRACSTLGIWTLIGLLLWWAGPVIAVWLLAAIGVLTQHELYRMLERMGQRPFRRLGLLLGAALILGPYYVRRYTDAGEARFGLEAAIIAAVVLVCCLRILWEREGTDRFGALSSTLFGLIFVPFMFQFFVRIFWLYGEPSAQSWQGLMAGIWVIAAAKFCDTGAYLIGTAIGRHRMAPVISPKKSWEGAIGGVIFAMLVSALLSWVLAPLFPPKLVGWTAALLAAPVAVAAIVSDLVESIIKRAAEVKDSGSSIPGIGGAFDLTDSLVLAAPTGWVLLWLFAY